MAIPEYKVLKLNRDYRIVDPALDWSIVPSIRIQNYLWLNNGYRPEVEIRLCYSERFLYVHFKVSERRIRARFTRFQDPVYKDSCVEFFVDPFPEKKLGYINIETNALGTMLIAIGRGREKHTPLNKTDLRDLELSASVKMPVDGTFGAEFWTLGYKLPQSLFEIYYGEKVRSGRLAMGNFYKCGDETEFPHFGAWSRIDSRRPDFHRPEYFGRILFA
jgi:hypothetical protein